MFATSSGCQQPDIQLGQVGGRLRPDDSNISVDQHQGAVLSGPGTQVLRHRCSPLPLAGTSDPARCGSHDCHRAGERSSPDPDDFPPGRVGRRYEQAREFGAR